VLSFLQGLEWLAEKHFHIESSDHLVVWNCGEAGPKKSAIEEKCGGGEWQSTIGPQKIPDHGSTRWGGDDSEQDEKVCYFSLAKKPELTQEVFRPLASVTQARQVPINPTTNTNAFKIQQLAELSRFCKVLCKNHGGLR